MNRRRLQKRNFFTFEQQTRRRERKAYRAGRAGIARIIVDCHLRRFHCGAHDQRDRHRDEIADADSP